ncbi:MAG: hypothetical protein ACO331_10955, partial [Prochlorothrix sp.]
MNRSVNHRHRSGKLGVMLSWLQHVSPSLGRQLTSRVTRLPGDTPNPQPTIDLPGELGSQLQANHQNPQTDRIADGSSPVLSAGRSDLDRSQADRDQADREPAAPSQTQPNPANPSTNPSTNPSNAPSNADPRTNPSKTSPSKTSPDPANPGPANPRKADRSKSDRSKSDRSKSDRRTAADLPTTPASFLPQP